MLSTKLYMISNNILTIRINSQLIQNHIFNIKCPVILLNRYLKTMLLSKILINIVIPFSNQNKTQRKQIVNRNIFRQTSQQKKKVNNVQPHKIANIFLPSKDSYQSKTLLNHNTQILNQTNIEKYNPYSYFQSRVIEPQQPQIQKNVLHSQKTKRRKRTQNYSEQKFDSDLKPWEMDKQYQMF